MEQWKYAGTDLTPPLPPALALVLGQKVLFVFDSSVRAGGGSYAKIR